MKIGVIGSGTVGQTLAKGLAGHGHEVRIGSREGKKLAEFTAKSGVPEATFPEVAKFAEVIILAVQGGVAEGVMREIGRHLDGKVVLDATNPIRGEPKDGVLEFFTAANESLLERIQSLVPAAKVVKFFNSVGAGLMVNPKLSGGVLPCMFICGNDGDAKQVAAKLARELGWNVEDVGSARAGHAVEALCQIWCAPGFLRNDWARAFAVLRP